MKLIEKPEEFNITRENATDVKQAINDYIDHIIESEGAGKVVIEAVEKVMTPQQAADFLGISRTWFRMSILDKGLIHSFPRSKGSTQRVLRVEDVEAYKKAQEKKTKNATATYSEGVDFLSWLDDKDR